MPLIVDKKKVQKDIFDALDRCIQNKSIMKLSLRDIAKEANMSHSKILTYFDSKEALLSAFVDDFTEQYASYTLHWFKAHYPLLQQEHQDEKTILRALMKALLEYLENHYVRALLELYSCSIDEPGLHETVKASWAKWYDALNLILTQLYHRDMSKEAQYIQILLEGVMFGTINQTIDLDDYIDTLLALL